MMNESNVGTMIAEKYRLESMVRESAHGDLYYARHEITGERLLLSVLPQAVAIDERWSRPFLDAAKAVAGVDAATVLKVVDLGTDRSGAAFVAYEGFAGVPLTEKITDIGKTDERRAVRIALQIADAVAAANDNMLVHGRLSPDHVLIADESGREQVKVVGFSADKFESSRGADARYLAPELKNEYPAVSDSSDTFSIGALLYEMLTGTTPFDGNVIDDEAAPLNIFRADIDTKLEPIVMTAIASDPEQRYPSAAALAQDLRLYLGESADKAVAASAGAGSGDIWKTAFLVLAGMLVLGGGFIYATYYRGTDPTIELVADEGSLPVQPIGPATGAQEESLSQLPALTDAELLAATTATMELPPGTLPGGDGYNPWANGGAPPPGAPPSGSQIPPYYIPPGQTVTIDPAGGSQFMPNESGVILVPVPANTPQRTLSNQRPTEDDEPTESTAPAANTSTPRAAPTPKPLATPPPRNPRPAADAQATPQPRTTRRGNQRQNQPPGDDMD